MDLRPGQDTTGLEHKECQQGLHCTIRPSTMSTLRSHDSSHDFLESGRVEICSLLLDATPIENGIHMGQ